jgi:hypothetical protein
VVSAWEPKYSRWFTDVRQPLQKDIAERPGSNSRQVIAKMTLVR